MKARMNTGIMLTMLLVVMLSLVFRIEPIKADGPDFDIVNAERVYSVEDGTGTDGQKYRSWGYKYNLTIQNIGSDADRVGVSIFPDFCDNGTKGGTAYYCDWKSGEIRIRAGGFSWPNEDMVPLNKWVKIVVNSTVVQTFFIYFEISSTTSASPTESLPSEETSVSGRLFEYEHDAGVSNRDLSVVFVTVLMPAIVYLLLKREKRLNEKSAIYPENQ